jgi:hypothetical protein
VSEADCIGRVGSLAVALGVGAAIVTGWGACVARADASGNSPGSTTSSPASGASNAESGGASHDTRKLKDGKWTTSATKPDKGTADATDDGNPSDPTDTPKGKGGVSQPDAAVHPGDVEDDESQSPTSMPHASKRSRTHARESAEAEHSAPATAIASRRHDPDPSADTLSRLPSAAIADSFEPVEADTTPVQISRVDSSLTATSFAVTPSKPNKPEATSVVTGLLTRFVHAVLSPFAASNGPSEPTANPAAWALLAFARREFDPAVRTQSVAMTPTVAQQISLSAPLTLANVFDVVETAVNTIFNTAMRLIEGPRAVPPGSTVTVETSTLQLPCSSAACTVPADWYFPAGSNPQGLIYFQHGALANSAMYSYTDATLAQETNSIVVAPTLPSFLTTDGLWLGGGPMQQVVADLFVGDRSALTASASAAAGQPVTLPQSVVFVGHSEGGGLVVGAAGDMASGPDAADLAGVIMLDGATLDRNLIATAAAKIPANTPILLIASPPGYWNQLGATASDLVSARPDQFDGVQLVGGTHADSVQGGNAFIQAIEQVVAGPSQPQNVDALTMLASGWINDMLTRTAIVGTSGQTSDIPTDAGTATAIALPAPPTPASPVDVVLNTFITFATEVFYNFAGTLTHIPL